jgi:predicted alpha/beta superfamily hydrolase
MSSLLLSAVLSLNIAALPPRLPSDAPSPRPLTIDRVEVHDLVSKVNGVSYELRISLPPSYEQSQARYPVVVLLDADYSFLIARNITDHLAERQDLPEVILVGVAYGGPPNYRVHRTRDYTPTFVATGGYSPEIQKVSGGAPQFRAVLETEVLPFVDRWFRTLPADRTLVGHSYGGLFATWTLFSTPQLFSRFIVVSPSLWYDDGMLFRLESKHATSPSAPTLKARVYACAGASENPRMPEDLALFDRSIGNHFRPRLTWKAEILDGETHNSIFPRCLSNGLRFVLEGTSPAGS